MYRLPKPVLYGVAVVFACIALLYSIAWTLYGSRGATVELGFENKYRPAEHVEYVDSVHPGIPLLGKAASVACGRTTIPAMGLTCLSFAREPPRQSHCTESFAPATLETNRKA